MRYLWVWGAAFFLALGCGSDGGDSGSIDLMCAEDFTGCGGDLVGTWRVERGCAEDAFEALCPEAVVDYSGAAVSGQLTFRADGSYESVIDATGTVRVEIPGSCLSGATDCSQIGDECTGDVTRACVCESEIEGDDAESGTYEIVDGDGLEISPDDGSDTEPQVFCVRGDTLLLADRSAEGGMVGAIYVRD